MKAGITISALHGIVGVPHSLLRFPFSSFLNKLRIPPFPLFLVCFTIRCIHLTLSILFFLLILVKAQEMAAASSQFSILSFPFPT